MQTVEQWLDAGNKITVLPTAQYVEDPEKQYRREIRNKVKEVLTCCTHDDLAKFAKVSKNSIGKIVIRYHVGIGTYKKVELAVNRIIYCRSFDKEAVKFCKEHGCFIDSCK